MYNTKYVTVHVHYITLDQSYTQFPFLIGQLQGV